MEASVSWSKNVLYHWSQQNEIPSQFMSRSPASLQSPSNLVPHFVDPVPKQVPKPVARPRGKHFMANLFDAIMKPIKSTVHAMMSG